MTVLDIGRHVQAGLGAWLAALAAIVFYQIITNPDRLRGLFRTGYGPAEPERIQLVAVFGFATGAYVLEAVKMLNAPGLPTRMPEVPQYLLTVLTGSQAVYLAGKTTHTLNARRNP